MADPALWVWRHPKPVGAAGLCVGARSDLPVHWRRAKRLARRIQQVARRQRLPHIVHTSPLRRCADVGAWLRRWGWQHRQDPALLELDFGSWDGQRWADIGRQPVDDWVANFAHHHAPGGGEALTTLLGRAAAWQPAPVGLGDLNGCVVISHGGWMLARRWTESAKGRLPSAAEWPTPPAYGHCWRFKMHT